MILFACETKDGKNSNVNWFVIRQWYSGYVKLKMEINPMKIGLLLGMNIHKNWWYYLWREKAVTDSFCCHLQLWHDHSVTNDNFLEL